MESGLDSIAMAVAHLERLGKGQHTQQRPTNPGPAPTTLAPISEHHVDHGTTTADMNAPPPPVSFGQAPRIVSVESFPSSGTTAEPSSLPTAPGPRSAEHLRPNENAVASSSTTAPASQVVARARTPSSENAAIAASAMTTSKPADPKEHKTAIKALATGPPTAITRQGRPVRNLEPYFEPVDFKSKNKTTPASSGDKTNEIVKQVLDDDVIFGRGGCSNHHSGNIQYRNLVKACQPAYLQAKRRDKPRIAAGIVMAVRAVGGRFLKKQEDDTWQDVGNTRAREKTSQALREGAPELRTGTTSSSAQKRPKTHAPPPPLVMRNVLEEAPQDIRQPPQKKQRPSSLESLAAAAAAKSTVVATVSGDDDDSSSSSSNTYDAAPKPPRGPRIKLLKQRLIAKP